MNLEQLAQEIGAHIETPATPERADIERVYAGDRMSDLLGAASERTLLATHIANCGLLRLIELMDVPAICFANGATPDPAVVEAARETGTALLVSPWDLYETCGRLYAALNHEKQRAAPS